MLCRDIALPWVALLVAGFLPQTVLPDLGAYHEAERLRDQGTAQSKRQAIDKFLEASAALHSTGFPKNEAEALQSAGSVYLSLSEYRKAMDLFERALLVIRALPEGDTKAESDALNEIGVALIYTAEYRKALETLGRARELCHGGCDKKQEASILNNIATVYCYLSDYDKGLEFYNQAIPFQRAAGNQAGEANTLISMSAVYDLRAKNRKLWNFCRRHSPCANPQMIFRAKHEPWSAPAGSIIRWEITTKPSTPFRRLCPCCEKQETGEPNR